MIFLPYSGHGTYIPPYKCGFTRHTINQKRSKNVFVLLFLRKTNFSHFNVDKTLLPWADLSWS
jgi:hypothetical protein